jgi:hypothetical protein
MEKKLSKSLGYFPIFKMLGKWVETLENLKKKKDIRLYSEVIESLEPGACTYEEFIVYLNYIAIDLATIIKSGTGESQKKYPVLTTHPHLDSHDMVGFLNVILPKVLFIVTMPCHFFPPALLQDSTRQNLHLLYSIQTLENIVKNNVHYSRLLKVIMKALLSMELEPSQVKELILNSFKYYYLFHPDKNYSASQLVIESLKKMTNVIRYAINDELTLFLATLTKLGKSLFLSNLTEKFQWMADLNSNATQGVNKDILRPFCSQTFGSGQQVKV